MNIQNRIERLERENRDAEIRYPTWNLKNVSTADLIELRNLIDSDPVKASDCKAGSLRTEHCLMNIQNRLEKLEARTLGNDSEHCGCVSYPATEVYFQKGDGVPMKDGLPMPDQPEVCERCHKPFDKRILIVHFVEAGEQPLKRDRTPLHLGHTGVESM